jgi:hypothetical protein
MEKIEAARRAQGLIELEGETDAKIKQAVEQVSTITALDGPKLHFEGHRIIEGHGYSLIVNCFDIYECPNGYLMQVYMDNSPNWAVSAKSISALLNAIPNKELARRAHGELVKKGLASIHHRF